MRNESKNTLTKMRNELNNKLNKIDTSLVAINTVGGTDTKIYLVSKINENPVQAGQHDITFRTFDPNINDITYEDTYGKNDVWSIPPYFIQFTSITDGAGTVYKTDGTETLFVTIETQFYDDHQGHLMNITWPKKVTKGLPVGKYQVFFTVPFLCAGINTTVKQFQYGTSASKYTPFEIK